MSSSEKTEDIVLPVCEQSTDGASIAISASPWKVSATEKVFPNNCQQKIRPTVLEISTLSHYNFSFI